MCRAGTIRACRPWPGCAGAACRPRRSANSSAGSASRGGNAPDGRKVRGTIHWVATASGLPAEIRLYNPLFTRPDPGADGDFMVDLNPDSLEILGGAVVEPGLAGANEPAPVQFERQGYFCRDPDSAPGRLVFNRTIGLRDSWAKPRAQAAGG